jgi:hypothetical protein
MLSPIQSSDDGSGDDIPVLEVLAKGRIASVCGTLVFGKLACENAATPLEHTRSVKRRRCMVSV